MVGLPVRSADWRLVGRTLRLVLGLPGYAAVAILVALVALSVFVFAQNLTFVEFALTGPLAIDNRIQALVELYPFVGTSFSTLEGAMLVLVALLTGADLALVTYHFREHDLAVREGGSSAIAVGLGVLGAGCAACGSAVLAGLLGLLGVGGLATALPLDGLEFSILAAVTLVLSMYWLADGMRGGEIRGCPVDPR